MSADDTPERERGEQPADSDEELDTEAVSPDLEDDELGSSDVRERLGEGADKAIDQFDEGLIDLLAWMLETETRARIYINLRKHPEQTSDEIAESTGLYPSTVREALASLHDDDIVNRDKRQNAGAGNNPYEYSAIPPSDLVSEVVDDIQTHLNAVFNLDKLMDRSDSGEDDSEPVTITVTEDRSESEEDDDESIVDDRGGEHIVDSSEEFEELDSDEDGESDEK